MADSMAKSNAEKEEALSLREKAEELDALLQRQNDEMTELRAEMEKTEGEIRLREEQRANDAANISRIRKEIAEKSRKQHETQPNRLLVRAKGMR